MWSSQGPAPAPPRVVRDALTTHPTQFALPSLHAAVFPHDRHPRCTPSRVGYGSKDVALEVHQMENSLGQYCVYVSDLDRSVAFWERGIGIPVQSRTEIPGVKEVVLQAEIGGSRIQLAQRLDDPGPIDMGSAMWKLYVDTDDCQALYDK